jgi:hemoglobin-like flavoprotein
MTPRQIQLVQESFEKVRPIAATAAEMFYGKLFLTDPSLRPLFKGDMKDQGRMLMAMIAAAVRGLSNPQALVPTLLDLGRKHVAYGVEDRHYITVGSSLLWTLEQGLGEAFDDELRDAWLAAYELLSGVMQQGAREARLDRAA